MSDDAKLQEEAQDPRLVACFAILGATGAEWTQIRYSDDEQPVVWIGVAQFPGNVHETDSGMTPIQAMFRLTERVIDGGTCTGCSKPTGISDSWDNSEQMPFPDKVCWWTYDASQESFVRGCDKKKPGVQK